MTSKRRATELRTEGKIPLQERMTHHLKPLAESTARSMLAKEFRPFQRPAGGSSSSTALTVDFPNFSRVLHKFVYPGAPPPREDVMKFLFRCCLVDGAAERWVGYPICGSILISFLSIYFQIVLYLQMRPRQACRSYLCQERNGHQQIRFCTASSATH